MSKKKKNKNTIFVIRSENGRGIYEHTTKSERKSLMNKYPGCSCATFNDMTKAQTWFETPAKKQIPETTEQVEHIEITDSCFEHNKDNAKMIVCETDFSKSELERLFSMYKNMGKKAINIFFQDGSNLPVFFEDYYYIKKNKFTIMNLDNIIYNLETSISIKEEDFSFEKIKKMFNDTLSSELKCSIDELPTRLKKNDLVGIIPKDKYKIIDNYLYIENAMPVTQKTELIDGLLTMTLHKQNNEYRKDVSFNLDNRIKYIKPFCHPAEITDDKWLEILKGE